VFLQDHPKLIKGHHFVIVRMTSIKQVKISMSHNRLTDETSPYLLQHQDNPVHWYAWGNQATEAAKTQNKPILLSIGYAACHWCHVMAHESFEDPDIASLMNDLFINIKVDREERPDIDHVYQSALHIMGEQGGWPLTMFLTPDGEPFWGGTYFPSTPKYGRAGFPQILQQLSHAFHEDNERVAQNVTAIREALTTISNPSGGGSLSSVMFDKAAEQILRMIDTYKGGTQGAPKFPQPALFNFLWRAYQNTGADDYKSAVTLTLDNLCQGGIYDHLGGGFSRYSTDEIWLAPHFEKMLYDNALLIELMTEVHKSTNSDLYEIRIRETISWVLRDMMNGKDDAQAFASAYDADSEGEEGKFYVWSDTEIDDLLGPAADKFKAMYDVTSSGNWEGKTILNRSANLDLLSEADETILRNARANLLSVRDKRIWPERDHKVLTDWNGLMVAALVQASLRFDEPAWMDAAKTAFEFICTHLSENGRLFHSWCQGDAAHPATLDDYANMSKAALALFYATGNQDNLDKAIDWVSVLDQHYWDNEKGGYFLSADDTDDVIIRAKTCQDNAVPPGNGTMLEVLAKLYLLTGDAAYQGRADKLMEAMTPTDPSASFYSLTLLSGFDFMTKAVQVVLLETNEPEELANMRKAVLKSTASNIVLMSVKDGTTLPAHHPANGKSSQNGSCTAYVCISTTCGLPITSADNLSLALEDIG
jgi:uncharacterized protein YyaL (SSP411 family)